MSNKDLSTLNIWAKQAEKAAKIVARNRFLIETYISFLEAKEHKGKRYTSIPAMFKKLGI